MTVFVAFRFVAIFSQLFVSVRFCTDMGCVRSFLYGLSVTTTVYTFSFIICKIMPIWKPEKRGSGIFGFGFLAAVISTIFF
jgi:hypothetical protein